MMSKKIKIKTTKYIKKNKMKRKIIIRDNTHIASTKKKEKYKVDLCFRIILFYLFIFFLLIQFAIY